MGIFSVILHTIFSVGHPQRFLPSSWLVLNCRYKEERGWLLMFPRERWESYSESQPYWQQKIFIFLENFLGRKYLCDATDWRLSIDVSGYLKIPLTITLQTFLPEKQNNFVWKCQFSFIISLKKLFWVKFWLKEILTWESPIYGFQFFWSDS